MWQSENRFAETQWTTLVQKKSAAATAISAPTKRKKLIERLVENKEKYQVRTLHLPKVINDEMKGAEVDELIFLLTGVSVRHGLI